MSTLRRVLVIASLSILLCGCNPPLSGTYTDVDDPSRFYTFSKWTKSWTSYYDESGSYEVEGDRFTLDTGGGLHGTLVSESEFQLEDVSGWHPEKPFRIYRRAAAKP